MADESNRNSSTTPIYCLYKLISSYRFNEASFVAGIILKAAVTNKVNVS